MSGIGSREFFLESQQRELAATNRHAIGKEKKGGGEKEREGQIGMGWRGFMNLFWLLPENLNLTTKFDKEGEGEKST